MKKSGGQTPIPTLQKKLTSPDISTKEQERLQMALNQLMDRERITWIKIDTLWYYRLNKPKKETFQFKSYP